MSYEDMTDSEPTTAPEVDYSIVEMPGGGYIVARSRFLGSLDYSVVCSCESHHEARLIVKGLNK